MTCGRRAGRIMDIEIHDSTREDDKMKNSRTICTLCNYIYDEAVGEPRQGIAPATPFNELPRDWHCPECGGEKEFFQPCSCASFGLYEQTCATHWANSEAAFG
jgi:rubredoxin